MSSPPAYRYQIVVRGECEALLASLIDGIEARSSRDGGTSVVVAVRDEAEFWGLLDRFQDLGLHLVSLNEVPPPRQPE
jgi:hypothetical protein